MICKNKLSILILVSVLLAVLVFSSSQAVFAEEAKYIIRVGFMDTYNPIENVTACYFAVFKNKLEQFTGGEVEVRLFPNGQLGSDNTVLRQVRAGNLEMSNTGAGALGSAWYPPLSIFELPFLFPDNLLAIDVLKLDNPFVKELVKGFKEETGVGILSLIPESFRNLTNNVRPIKTVNDLKGLKIRVMKIPAHMKMIEATGAQAVPIAFSELYTSLQTGVVDGQENPLGNIVSMHFDEVQKYLTMSKHALNCATPVYNIKWFESLPEGIQCKIMKAAVAARVSTAGLSHIHDVVNLGKVKESGMEVYVPSPEELLEFKRVMQPDALELFKTQVKGGAEMLSKLEKEIEKAEQKYKNLAD